MIAAALFLATKGWEGIDLTWRPKVGEVHVYRVSVRLDYPSATVEFRFDLQNRVTAIAKDGSYTLESLSLNPVMVMDGQSKDMPRNGPDVQRYDRKGVPILDKTDTRDADPFADLMDHLTEYQTPGHSVSVGDTWVNQTTGDKKGAFGEPWITYSLVDIPKNGLRSFAKLKLSAHTITQSEAATGTIYLSRPSNALFNLDETIPHFQPSGEVDVARVDIQIQEKIPDAAVPSNSTKPTSTAKPSSIGHG